MPRPLIVATIPVLALFLSEFAGITTAKTLHVRISPVIAFAPVIVMHKTTFTFEYVAVR